MSLYRNKNFMILFSDRIFINIGEGIFYIVAMWSALTLGKSAIYVGIAGFLFRLPEVLSVFWGPFIDRSNPKKILIVANLLQAILLGATLYLDYMGLLRVGLLLMIILFTALLSEFTYPLEDVLLPKLVGGNELVQANALVSVVYKGLELLFNGISGVLISSFSFTVIYGVNFLVFLIPLLFIHFLKIDYKKQEVRQSLKSELRTYKEDLLDGLRFVKKPLMMKLLIPLVFVNFLLAIVMVNLPLFAKQMGHGAIAYGFMLGSLGLGSMFGSVIIDKIRIKHALGRILPIGIFLSGVPWILIPFTLHHQVLVYLLLFISDMFLGAINVLFSVLFQTLPEEHLLGRVGTAIGSMITVAMPIGSLIGGALSEFLPIKFVLSLFGVGLIIESLFYICSKAIRSLPIIDKIDHTFIDN